MKLAAYVDANYGPLADLLINPGMFSVPSNLWLTAHHPVWSPYGNVKLGDRAYIEDDESKLQILPYVTLFDAAGRVYCYRRGVKGDESRLRGAISIGLGGHVDSLPDNATTMAQHLINEAQRELLEEVGMPPNAQSVTFSHLLIDRTNAVGRVHLGLWGRAYAQPGFVPNEEAAVVTCGEFRHPDSFTSAEFAQMENWSKLCLLRLVTNLPKYLPDLTR